MMMQFEISIILETVEPFEDALNKPSPDLPPIDTSVSDSTSKQSNL